MSQAVYQWPAFRKILPDVAAFAFGLGIAFVLRWKTTDLVWSLWLGSLVLGYLTILSTIGCRGITRWARERMEWGTLNIEQATFNAQYRTWRKMAGLSPVPA